MMSTSGTWSKKILNKWINEKTHKRLNRMLFNQTKQDGMQIVEGILFFKATDNTKTNKSLSCCHLSSSRRICAWDWCTNGHFSECQWSTLFQNFLFYCCDGKETCKWPRLCDASGPGLPVIKIDKGSLLLTNFGHLIIVLLRLGILFFFLMTFICLNILSILGGGGLLCIGTPPTPKKRKRKKRMGAVNCLLAQRCRECVLWLLLKAVHKSVCCCSFWKQFIPFL